MLAANLGRGSTRLMLPQDPNDLLLAEPATLHRPSPLSDGLYPNLEEFLGLRSCRLDKRADAHHLLTGVYGYFTEDFDTADLRDAKAFLGELSRT